jgi:isopentenyldiphosphate isomerase
MSQVDDAMLTDPHELLEVYDLEGRPTGVAKQRALRKDVFPGRFDASSAGHVRFGETLEEAAREIEEELGIRVELAELTPLPRHRQQHHPPNGLIDREHHALHLLAVGPPDDAYRPSLDEVLGLAWIDGDDLVALAGGQAVSATVRYRAVDGPNEAFGPRELRASELVPYDEGYHRRLVEQARAHVEPGR